MERNTPNPRPSDARDAETYDTLRSLEQRLDSASDAAEQLIAQATARARAARAPDAGGAGGAGGAGAAGAAGAQGDGGAPGAADPRPGRPSTGRAPPAGWQVPAAEPQPGDTELLLQLLRSVRELLPPELERRIAEALRELLLALRALIDWYLERAQRRGSEPDELRDIPIL